MNKNSFFFFLLNKTAKAILKTSKLVDNFVSYLTIQKKKSKKKIFLAISICYFWFDKFKIFLSEKFDNLYILQQITKH